MNTIQRIAKNVTALFAAQFVVSILGLILSIFIARSLGPVIFGEYSFALAFTAIFAVFSDLGYNTLLIREVARDKSQASKYLNNILCMRALLSLVIFALIVITINLMGYPADTKNVVYLFGIYTLIVSFSAVFKVTFRAFEKMEYEAGITILANIIRISLGLLVLFLGYGLVELALVFLFSGVFDFLLSFLICGRRFVKPKLELDLDFWKSTIKVAFPLSITGISILIYTRVDTVMLSLMDGDAAVGWYNAAYNLILGVKPLPKIIMTVLFPLMSSYFVSSKDSLRSLWKRSLKYFLIIALPASTGIALLADKIILLCYGEQFYPSIIALRILAWDVLLFVLWQSSTFVLISANKQKLWSFIAIITATVNILFNLILIPYLSYVGAAIATIIAEGVCVALLFYFTCSLFKEIPDYKYLIKPLIASLFMGLFIHLLNSLNVLILIISSACLYFVALYFLKTFSDEDIYIFKRMVKK